MADESILPVNPGSTGGALKTVEGRYVREQPASGDISISPQCFLEESFSFTTSPSMRYRKS